MGKRNRRSRRPPRKKFVLGYAPPGTAPGTIRLPPEARPSRITIIAYGPDAVEEAELESAADVRRYLERFPVVWLNVDGLGSEAAVARLGEVFGLHRLVLEDITNLSQRAKVEIYDDSLFAVARMPVIDARDTEQISFVLRGNAVLTVQETPGDVLDPVRDRIRQGKGRIRQAGPDYLLYALIDAVVDSYFPVVETMAEELETLEDEVLTSPTRDAVGRIHEIRRDLLGLRKAAWPHRDMLNQLLRDSSAFITRDTELYVRDSYDHALRIIDLTEALREMASDLMNTYMSAVSNRMNEVMKVLTIIATIFIPLSFIAGVYGMNFDRSISAWNMPELGWRFGYPFALGMMAAVAVGFLLYFRRKGWLG